MNNSRVIDDEIRNKNRNIVWVSYFVIKAVKEMMHVDNMPNISAVIAFMSWNGFPRAIRSLLIAKLRDKHSNQREWICQTNNLNLSTSAHQRKLQSIATDRNSYGFKHLNNSINCNSHYTPKCFQIFVSTKTTYALKLKEATYIQNKKRQLNTQIHHINTFLLS